MLKGSKRSACSRFPATATTIEGRLTSSSSRPANRRSGWNNISRCGPASILCQPLLSSGIDCCIRGLCITHLPFKNGPGKNHPAGARRPSLHAVEPHRAAGQYLSPRLGGERPEPLADHVGRTREKAVLMRVVGRPHDL